MIIIIIETYIRIRLVILYSYTQYRVAHNIKIEIDYCVNELAYLYSINFNYEI